MDRKTFLTIASIIALLVGTVAIIFPGSLLQSKGVEPISGTVVWVTEVGILLIAVGIIAFGIRKHETSATMKVILFGNIIIQIGLTVIELIAYSDGIITKLSGIIPNIALHIIMATGFIYYWWQKK